MRVIKSPDSDAAHKFTKGAVAFMQSVSTRYQYPNMAFFLTTGPMENTTMLATQNSVPQGNAAGLNVHWVDMRAAVLLGASLHAPGDSDHCGGCTGHPGIQGHKGNSE
jgi:hypothetical protein